MVELDHNVGGGEALLRAKRVIASHSVYLVCGLALTKQLHGVPIANSGSAHTGKKTSLEAIVHLQETTRKAPNSASQAVFSRIQLTLRTTRRAPHDASHLVRAMSWWVQIDVLRHGFSGMRGGMVLQTTATHDTMISTNSLPLHTTPPQPNPT